MWKEQRRLKGVFRCVVSDVAPPFPPKSKESPVNSFRVGFGWEGCTEVLTRVQVKPRLIPHHDLDGDGQEVLSPYLRADERLNRRDLSKVTQQVGNRFWENPGLERTAPGAPAWLSPSRQKQKQTQSGPVGTPACPSSAASQGCLGQWSHPQVVPDSRPALTPTCCESACSVH